MLKKLIKELIPPFVLRFLSGLYIRWHGNYPDWGTACKKSQGYDSDSILRKVLDASLKVKNGEAVYERDSVIFNEIQYSYPVLSSLMWIAAKNNGRLNVLDFGGSLGSSYFQNKKFIDSLKESKWCIVEQDHYVKAGQEHLADDRLKFYYTIEDCLSENNIDVVLLSGVLQYLEKPFEILNSIIEKNVDYILIDRLQLVNKPDRITIQVVSPKIYKASYPCWFFNKNKFMNFMNEDYELILDFETLGFSNIKSEFRGFLYRHKKIKD